MILNDWGALIILWWSTPFIDVLVHLAYEISTIMRVSEIAATEAASRAHT